MSKMKSGGYTPPEITTVAIVPVGLELSNSSSGSKVTVDWTDLESARQGIGDPAVLILELVGGSHLFLTLQSWGVCAQTAGRITRLLAQTQTTGD